MKLLNYKFLIFLLLFVSFFIFSRFTVDDAFISWRYAKNFIDFGIWNYNPSTFDITQSYTSPLLTFIALLPEVLGINTVLFFKIFSLINAFFVYFIISERLKNNSILLIIFFTIPSTVIHIFSGLETFFFVSILFLLFVSMYKNLILSSFIYGIILILTRPESYSLAFILPAYFAFNENFFFLKNNIFCIKKNISNSLVMLISLLFVILSLCYFNYLYFGHPLTNSFYVKSDSFFRPSVLLLYTFFILPAFYLLFIKRIKLLISIVLLFLPMSVVYSTSSLGMNYNMRFLFHIFAPIFLFILYISRFSKSEFIIKKINSNLIFKLKEKRLINYFLIPFLLIFFYQSNFELRGTFTYYPRLLDSLGAFGHELNLIKKKYNLKNIAYGDAGLLPFNSSLNNLDLFFLGSSKLTFDGINSGVVELYSPDLIFFHTKNFNTDIRESENQKALMYWAQKRNYIELCHLYVSPDYVIKIVSFIDIPELKKICSQSKMLNSFNDHQYIKKTIFFPPWNYWRN